MKRLILWLAVGGTIAFLLSNDIRDYKNGQWYDAHCTPSGDRWPCSDNNPIP